MAINKQRLKKALSTIRECESGCFQSCKFMDLMNPMCWNIVQEKRHNECYNYIQLINRHIQNIETIVFRLVSQKDLYIRKGLDMHLWMEYGALDIELFHVKLRSIFDHVAKIIGLISDKPGQVKGQGGPYVSFETLKNWVKKKDSDGQKIGTDLAKFMLSCEWFDDLRGVRNTIMHYLVYTLVLPPKEDKILFQVDDMSKNRISRKVQQPEEVMYNENLANFELYAGLYIGYLIAYLEELSEIVDRRLNLNKVRSDFNKCHSRGHLRGRPELKVLKDWIEQVLQL